MELIQTLVAERVTGKVHRENFPVIRKPEVSGEWLYAAGSALTIF